MKFATLRRIKRTQAPRHLRRRDFPGSDATTEADPSPPPEAVFDRVTGPFRGAYGGLDEET